MNIYSLASHTLVEHFLVRCEEFRWERQDLLEKIRQMNRVDWNGAWGMRERWHYC